jgi:hypothetical protein
MGIYFVFNWYVHDMKCNQKFRCLMTIYWTVECLKDVDLFTLWAEETLIEDNLVLDILFLAYDDPFCTCGSEIWKKFGSIFKVY